MMATALVLAKRLLDMAVEGGVDVPLRFEVDHIIDGSRVTDPLYFFNLEWDDWDEEEETNKTVVVKLDSLTRELSNVLVDLDSKFQDRLVREVKENENMKYCQGLGAANDILGKIIQEMLEARK